MSKTKVEPVAIPGGRKAAPKSTAAQRKTPEYRAGYRDCNAHWTVIGRNMREDAYRVGLADGAAQALSVLRTRLDKQTRAGEIGDIGSAISFHVIERQAEEMKRFVDRLSSEAKRAAHRIARTQAEIIREALFDDRPARTMKLPGEVE